MTTRCLALLVALTLGWLASAQAPGARSAAGSAADSPTGVEPTVIFLVRHAEKQDDGSRDPALSQRGVARASQLAAALRDAGIEHVHSTDYQRTRDTAGPVAHRLNLDVALYDPRDLGGALTRVREAGGRHLIVGHSNTTPAAVQLLGGDPGSAIDEKEYDRLYIVTLAADEPASTVLLRYGE